MKPIKDAEKLKGKRVLVRCDFNVPVSGKTITDDYRIQRTLPLLSYLQKEGAKTTLVSHIESEEKTLMPVFAYLKKTFSMSFVHDIYDQSTKEIYGNLPEGDFLMLENVRRYEGEMSNDEKFANDLSKFGEIYVNEAFSASHRAHASIVGVPKYIPGFAGLLFDEEVKNLSKAFNPPHPFLFILAGAKFSTKLPLVEKFLKLADTVFIGGALANDLFKAEGYETGKSLVSEEKIDFSSILKNPKLILPEDVTVENAGKISVETPDVVSKEDKMTDAGPKTDEVLEKKIKEAKFILWNGPLGQYEKGFKEPTFVLAKAIAESGVEAIVGGGDTLATIRELNLFEKFSFVSTGGGAMLEFLANETLPGIEALKKA
ncbi:MAG: phosphoglycerate kinase [Candidatus Pacebacteria bacterium]|nr:phosphoglycerate kinase [Candidatus Paceibacterota bacterium]